jgi:hypothetical protein
MDWKTRWNNFRAGLKITDWIIAIFTAVLSVVAILQYREMKSGGIDTHALADAAAKQAKAAEKFADNAANINTGIQNAVTQLGKQVAKMDTSVQQASRLAAATETANKNSVEADRPWMAAYINVAQFAVDKKSSFIFTFANTGKRPAIVELTAARSDKYVNFPSNTDAELLKNPYVRGAVPSTSVIVPGQPVVASSTSPGALTKAEMDLIDSGQVKWYAFAKVEYRDVRTNLHYWTHICIEYMPLFKTDNDNGFRNCPEYNDAQ